MSKKCFGFVFFFLYSFLSEAAVKFESVMAYMSFWDSEVQILMSLRVIHANLVPLVFFSFFFYTTVIIVLSANCTLCQ